MAGLVRVDSPLVQAGEWKRAREAALQSATITSKLFGTHHQDILDANKLLAKIHFQEGDSAGAQARAEKD
jgi:hypothetical protein